MLVIAGGGTPGMSKPAHRPIGTGDRRWSQPDPVTCRDPQLRCGRSDVADRRLSRIRRGCRWIRPRRGLRRRRAQATLRCHPRWRSGARRCAGLSGESRRSFQRTDGAQPGRSGRSVTRRMHRCRYPAAGDRLCRGARDRHTARRPHRSPCPRRGLWAGPAAGCATAGRRGQDQPWPPGGSRGHRRPDQDNPGSTARHDPGESALRYAEFAHSV